MRGSPLAAAALASSRGFVLNCRSLMRISDFIARTITQRRALVWCGVATLTIVCIAILFTSLRLDSEIFNVLPGKFPSVQGLKTYDHDFEQTRELTFALVSDPQDVDKLEEFAPVFAERLRGEPWCARVLAGSPMAGRSFYISGRQIRDCRRQLGSATLTVGQSVY